MMSLIEQWRLMDAQDTLQLYVMLDSLHVPNPISHWCEHEWVSQLRPLYYQTPLESMLKASPFLCQLAPSKLAEIERWIDEQLDTPWGWLYLSRQPWLQQITHWHNHLRILIDGQLRAVRLQDPRVLSLWLEEQEPALWQGLLDPEADYVSSRTDQGCRHAIALDPANQIERCLAPQSIRHQGGS
jgi:hypothetical protein